MRPNHLKQSALSTKELKRILHYNPNTGIFTRNIDCKSAKAGDVAGHWNKNGYVYIKLHCVTYLAHRLAWLYMTGRWPLDAIDHIDLDKHNNSWANLREANGHSNNYNKIISKRNTTGFKGVWFNRQRQKWES